jgi:cysteinyl-tRNA synthetase
MKVAYKTILIAWLIDLVAAEKARRASNVREINICINRLLDKGYAYHSGTLAARSSAQSWLTCKITLCHLIP